MIPDDLLLLDPWFLAAIPVVLLLGWLGARRRPSAVPTASVQLLAGLPVTLRQRLAPLPRILWTLGVVAVVLALARPVTREILPLTAEGLDIVLLVDVSSSMNYTDVERSGTRRRIDAARDRAMEFAEARDRDRVGLVSFARFPELRCPPTLDENSLAAFLRPIDTVVPDSAEDGTAIGAALLRAVQVLSRTEGESRVAVLLSDGEETVGTVKPADAAKLAADEGVKVYAIGLGQGQRLPFGGFQPNEFTALQEIADTTGGQFFRARTEQELAQVYAVIDELETTELEDPRYRTTDRYLPILLAAGGCLLVGLLLELLVIRRVPG